jgi:tRNA-specific 2-thiouridylase
MSGGVDSSVSACLLRDEGYEVIGLFMRTGAQPEPSPATCSPPSAKTRGCCSAIDADDAQRVAARLGFPFYALNFAEEFGRIKDYFVDEYLQGRTPNPCVVCNTWLKFGKLWEYAAAVEADYIATGHYAQVRRGAGGTELHRACDPTKDQSYFLFGIRPEILDRVLFPIGHLPKSEVRATAEREGLGVSQKPDSQEICFVPTGNYMDFVNKHAPHRSDRSDRSGSVVDGEGRVYAQHGGIEHFTIGQRKGLGVAVGEPRFVVDIKPATREVVIGPRELLARDSLEAERVNWLVPTPPTSPVEAEVKIRYLHTPARARVTPIENSGHVRVEFETPQQSVTPGQAVVFYKGTRVLGGGWIASH